jgi:Bacterial SH3 domain
MTKHLIFLFIFLLALTINAQVHVRGYTRSDGTYVAPYMRSTPNSTPTDNYSYPGNTNPYTGKTATGNPDTYLKNYDNSNNTSSSDVWVEGYTRKDGTCVQGHWRSAPNRNPYDNYSYPGNTNPYTGKTATGTPDTYLRNYYVKSNTLNVRAGPSKKYQVINSLNYGENIEVLETSNPYWTKVRTSYFDTNTFETKYKMGYVYSSFISSANPLYTSNNELSAYNNNTYNSNSSLISTSTIPYGLHKGKISIWTNCPDDGAISVYINKIYKGKITYYFQNNSTPRCGDKGTLDIILPEGTYKLTAEGTNNKWEDNITIKADECNQEQLPR